MEFFDSFVWFAAGATLALVVKYVIDFYEEIQSTESLVSSLFFLVKGISAEIQAGIYFKHETLKMSEIPDNIIKKIIREDISNFEDWKKRIILFLLTSLPKKYYTYLRYRFSSNEEIILHFTEIAERKHREK